MKKSDTDPKAFQQIELVEHLKNTDGTQSIFVSTILENLKETGIKFSQRSVTVL